MRVKPKKYLGQHFLKDSNIAKAITQSLTLRGYQNILEIGPGMGALTTHLANIPAKIKLLEIDTDSEKEDTDGYLSEEIDIRKSQIGIFNSSQI